MPTIKLTIKSPVWHELVHELKERGKGLTESGAFLLGPSDGQEITKFICYDELDPEAYSEGIITFDGGAYVALWDHCRQNNLKVLADVHTHPGNWAGQSTTDKKHPMIPVAGHVALIIPRYAQNKQKSLAGVGLFEYLGDKKWKPYGTRSGIFKVIK
jgi:proteasome lid subunit RPN8/RPN11